MARRKIANESTRNIQKTRDTYSVSLPVQLLRKLGWKKRQKVVVKKWGKDKLIISDWKKK